MILYRLRAAGAACVLVTALAGCTSSAQSAGGSPSAGGPPSQSGSAVTTSGLPLHGLSTRNATQVVTVDARNPAATTAELQAWTKTPSGTWRAYGRPSVAHVGAGGLTTHERESLTETPIGSFTLTQAFGRLRNPGTSLPYFQTTPDDWWISQAGPLYNTHARCFVHCTFTRGSPNARLFYVSPQYDYAVVIDYNRHPVVQGAGSGIFLHVTRGRPTAGCVSIARGDLVHLMRWLRPGDHPRILIGVG